MTGDRFGDETSQTSLRVVEAVADERGVEPTELEPLYGSIDPDGLDSLFPADDGAGDRPGPQLSFTFAERRVRVSGDGSIAVTPAAHAHPGEPSWRRESDSHGP